MMTLIRNRGDGLARIAAARAVRAAAAAFGFLRPDGRGERSVPRIFATDGARLSGCSAQGRETLSGRMACGDLGGRMPEKGTIRFLSSDGG